MPRGPRELSEYGIYHVILRGNGKKIIFDDDDDCRFFLRILDKAREKLGFKIYAYCLMGNHVHLVINEEKTSLEQIFRRVATTYALHYNEKYGFSGHLFQDRYKSEIIDSEHYLLSCLRYVCRNPVKAGLCEDPRNYSWLGIAGIWDRGLVTNRIKELGVYNDASIGEFMLGPCTEKHIEYDDGRIDDRRASEIIRKLSGYETPQELSALEKNERKIMIERLLRAGVRAKQLARLTGISIYHIQNVR